MTTSTARGTGWVPLAVAYTLVAIVGATAATASAYYLWRLAVATGEPDWLAWSLPVTLDAGAAGGTILWVAGPARVRVWARGIALSALAGTLVGNALSHLIAAGVVPVSPVLVVAIGVMSPAMAAALAHLAHLAVLEHQPAADASEHLEVSADASAEAGDASVMPQGGPDESGASAHASVAAPLRRRSTLSQRQHWMHRQLEAGADLTGAAVERRFGSRNGARELRRVLAMRATSQFDLQAVSSPG